MEVGSHTGCGTAKAIRMQSLGHRVLSQFHPLAGNPPHHTHTQHCFAAHGDRELRTVLERVKKPSEVAKVEKQSTSGYKQQGYRSTKSCCHYSCTHPVTASHHLTAGKEGTEPKTSFTSDPESPYCKCLHWGTVL